MLGKLLLTFIVIFVLALVVYGAGDHALKKGDEDELGIEICQGMKHWGAAIGGLSFLAAVGVLFALIWTVSI